MTVQVVISIDPATLAVLQQVVAPHNQQLDRIEAAIAQLTKGESEIMADLSALTAQVTQNTSVEASAVTLLNNIGAQLKAAGTDPVALAALQTQLSGSATALAAAITANTPAAPPPAPGPA